MKRISTALFCAALIAGPADAAINKISGSEWRAQLQPMITTITKAQLESSLTGGRYSGVGSLFVSYKSTETTGFGSLCTGSLVGGKAVLTAAHCLYDYEEGSYDPVTAITFYLPSRGERSPMLTYEATSWTVNPDYRGFAAPILANDVALFTLDRQADGHVYSLYEGQDGGEFDGPFTRVGTGTIGDETGTQAGPYDFNQRSGQNLFEYYGDEVFSDVSHAYLLSDFDDGSMTHDVFGRAGGNLQTGLTDAAGNIIDTDSSPGDSGGPSFINGKIAAITSFGVTGAVFDGFCGLPSDIDPYFNADGRCTNSSIGEIAGDIQVSGYLPFIKGYIASVPEPSTWALYIAGFGSIGFAQRRRRVAATA